MLKTTVRHASTVGCRTGKGTARKGRRVLETCAYRAVRSGVLLLHNSQVVVVVLPLLLWLRHAMSA